MRRRWLSMARSARIRRSMWAPCDECGNDQPLQRTGAAGIPEPPEAINHARHQRSQPARVLGAEAQLDKMVDHLRRNQLQTHHKWEMSANFRTELVQDTWRKLTLQCATCGMPARPPCFFGSITDSRLRLALTLWGALAVGLCFQGLWRRAGHAIYPVCCPVFPASSRHWWADMSLYADYRPTEQVGDYRYSPTFAVAFTPLAYLPWPCSGIAWGIGSIAVLLVALHLMAREMLPGTTASPEATYVALRTNNEFLRIPPAEENDVRLVEANIRQRHEGVFSNASPCRFVGGHLVGADQCHGHGLDDPRSCSNSPASLVDGCVPLGRACLHQTVALGNGPVAADILAATTERTISSGLYHVRLGPLLDAPAGNRCMAILRVVSGLDRPASRALERLPRCLDHLERALAACP